MVTLQELEQTEQEAQQILREEVPQRRFGKGVTREQQQVYYQRKEQARKVIQKVRETKAQIQEGEQKRRLIEEAYEGLNYAINKTVKRYGGGIISARELRGVKEAFEKAGLNPAEAERVYVEEVTRAGKIEEALKREAIRKKLGEQGINPVYDSSGKIVGIEDTVTGQSIPIENIPQVASASPENLQRYRQAGIIEVKYDDKTQKVEPTFRERLAGQSMESRGYPEAVEPTKSGYLSRVQTRITAGKFSKKETTSERQLEQFTAGIGKSLLSSVQFIKTASSQSPITTGKQVVSGAVGTGKKLLSGALVSELKYNLKTQPAYTIGKITGDIILLKGTGEILSFGKRLTVAGITKISPSYKPLKLGKIEVQTGTAKILEKYDLPGARALDIKVTEKLPKLPLKKQLSLAGTTQDIVSAQRGLFSVLKREVEIKKPIPSQEKLTSLTRKGLENINRLTPKQLGQLNLRIQKEAGAKGLLERGFFADPFGRLRPSRLGLETKRARLWDILSGNVQFKRAKPQALLFEKQTIAKFPKDLNKITGKIATGKPLTQLEIGKLLKFQVKQTGQFKPLGFVSREAEVIAFGKIKKGEGLGVTLIKGQRVQLTSAKLEKLTKIEQKELTKALEFGDIKGVSKITGISTSDLISKPYLSPYRVSAGTGIMSLKGVSSKLVSYRKLDYKMSIPKQSYKITYKQIPTGYKTPSYRYQSYIKAPNLRISSPVYYPKSYKYPAITKIPGTLPPLIPKYPTPPRTPPKTPTIRIRKARQQERALTGYRTYYLRGGKKFYLPGITTKGRALETGQRYARQTLRATFGIEKTPFRVKQKDISFKVPQNIFRGYKIRGGKRIKLQDTFIQRRGKRLGTLGEIGEIQRLRSIKI